MPEEGNTRSRFNALARRCWRCASHARSLLFFFLSSSLTRWFARQPSARHFLFTDACECSLKRARSRRRLDLTALSYGGPLDSSPLDYLHPLSTVTHEPWGMNVRIRWPNEWRSDVCFECRFSRFVSAGAATVVFRRARLSPSRFFFVQNLLASPSPFCSSSVSFSLYPLSLSRRSRNTAATRLLCDKKKRRKLVCPLAEYHTHVVGAPSLAHARFRISSSSFSLFVFSSVFCWYSRARSSVRSTNSILAVIPDKRHCSPSCRVRMHFRKTTDNNIHWSILKLASFSYKVRFSLPFVLDGTLLEPFAFQFIR